MFPQTQKPYSNINNLHGEKTLENGGFNSLPLSHFHQIFHQQFLQQHLPVLQSVQFKFFINENR